MITDMKEIAKCLRTEANYWRDYIFNMSNYRFTESVLIAFGMGDMDIYADMPVYELFDKLVDIIDPQSS
nr:MAG TPA: leucine zipper protein [Caudoviricetes sp.]